MPFTISFLTICLASGIFWSGSGKKFDCPRESIFQNLAPKVTVFELPFARPCVVLMLPFSSKCACSKCPGTEVHTRPEAATSDARYARKNLCVGPSSLVSSSKVGKHATRNQAQGVGSLARQKTPKCLAAQGQHEINWSSNILCELGQ